MAQSHITYTQLLNSMSEWKKAYLDNKCNNDMDITDSDWETEVSDYLSELLSSQGVEVMKNRTEQREKN